MSNAPFRPPHPPSSSPACGIKITSARSHVPKRPRNASSRNPPASISSGQLDPDEIHRLELLAQRLGAQVTTKPEVSNVVVTVLKAPKRIVKWFADGEVNVVPAKVVGREGGGGGEVGGRGGRDWRRFVVEVGWLEAVQREGTLVDPDLYPAVRLKVDAQDQPQDRGEMERKKRKRSPSDSPLLPTTSTAPPLKLPRRTSSSSTLPTSSNYYDPLYPPPTAPLAKHALCLSSSLPPPLPQSTPNHLARDHPQRTPTHRRYLLRNGLHARHLGPQSLSLSYPGSRLGSTRRV